MKISRVISLGAVSAVCAATPVTAFASEVSLPNSYGQGQVITVASFSDVQPTDWAYQALSNLVERYGCVAGYSSGAFKGSQALTRFEAAALLNACLDRVTEVTDDVRRLQTEFASELVILNGRMDKAEARVSALESTQFSTTTKLRGEATFALGGVPDLRTDSGYEIGNTAFNYDVRLNFDTSFTGKDLLRTRLRAGNFSTDPFGSSSSLFKLDKAENTGNSVEIDRLYYQFPVGNNVAVTAGPLVRNTEMAWLPTAYKSEVLDFFSVAGAPGVYNKATGTGVGVQYSGENGIVAGINYVAQNGDDSSTGFFEDEGALNAMVQLGYKANNWGAAVSYRYGTEGSRVRNFNALNGGSAVLASGQESNSVAVNAYWQPSSSGIIPSVSAGYGYNSVSGDGPATGATDSDSWYVGLQWSDVFAQGNTAGVAFGQAPSADIAGVEDATMVEVFYKFRVSDNITVTPAVFYVDNNQRFENSDKWGGIIQTTFRF
jgi:hypothetical protein